MPRVCYRTISPLVLQELIYHLKELGLVVHGALMGKPEIPPQTSLNRLKVLKQRLQLSLGLFAPALGFFLGWSSAGSVGAAGLPPHIRSDQRMPSDQRWGLDLMEESNETR